MKPSNRRIRVLVADDSAAAVRCICRYLEFEDLFEVVGTALDGQKLLHLAGQLRPDLVLTDLSMPWLNGLEASTQLRKLFPNIRILVVTQLSGLSLRDECIRRGADGLVEKDQMPEALMQEVRRLFSNNA